MKFLLFSIVLSGHLLFTKTALASVIITEVHPNPLSGPEWVELFNPDSVAVDLSNWTIEDQLTSPTVAASLTQSLSPQSYLKIDLTSQKLNNTSDGVTLKNHEGVIMDQMSYTSTTPGLSWTRASSGGTFVLSEASPGQAMATPVPSPSPSPAAASPTPMPTPSSNPAAHIYLQASEIMACPETGEPEWLEVYNPTDYILHLDDWRIRDTAENLRTVSGSINPHAYGSFSWSSGLLNNTGDTLALLTRDSDQIFSATFGPCFKQTSFIYDQEAWKVTTTVTRDQVNTLTAPIPTPSNLPLVSKPTPSPKTLTTSPSPANPNHTSEKPETATTNPTSATVFQSLESPTSATSSLQLSADIYHPFDSPSVIDFTQSNPSLGSFIGVIMGGTVLLATHGLKLYRWYQHALDSISVPLPTPPRALFRSSPSQN